MQKENACEIAKRSSKCIGKDGLPAIRAVVIKGDDAVIAIGNRAYIRNLVYSTDKVIAIYENGKDVTKKLLAS